MDKTLKILIVEDVPFDAELIERVLQKEGFLFVSKRVDTREDFIQALDSFLPDLILSDHSLPQFDSMSAFKIVKEKYPEIPFVLVTGSVSEEFAVECMKAGVDDYILKSSLVRLPPSIKNILSKKKIIKEKDIVESLNKRLKKVSENLKEMNRDLVDSIVYAKQIQEAVLPDHSLIEKYFPNSFLIYEPKNIVSGDFFWIAEQNNKIIVAVVDCTGHGVPGALMSMMGNDFLNEVVFIKNKTQPSQILKELNISLRKALRQDREGSSSRDGMDIAVCTIDYRKGILEFAGANRPFMYTKNQNIHVIKGDKKSIGGLQEDTKISFTDNRFILDEIDNFYLFTDGYTDQFGGKKEKKFLSKKFRETILMYNEESMPNQKKALLNELRHWQGNMEQTDDICVLGVRVSEINVQYIKQKAIHSFM